MFAETLTLLLSFLIFGTASTELILRAHSAQVKDPTSIRALKRGGWVVIVFPYVIDCHFGILFT